MLNIQNLNFKIGGLQVINDLSIEVKKGNIHAIIGPNGAGKTSILNIINGIYKASNGNIDFQGKNITNMKPYKIARLGVARAFQNVELFKKLTVLENILIGCHMHIKYGAFHSMFWYGKALQEELIFREKVENIIDFLEMEKYRKQVVGMLPYGIQKLVEVARALAMNPTLLLLDEPAVGMNREEKENLARFIIEIQEELGITIIMVDHDMRLVMDISDVVTVLDYGKKISEGSPDEVVDNPEVINSYLGTINY